MTFELYNKDMNKIVSIDKLLKEEWTKSLIYCDIDGFYIGEDGSLILADECGNFAYVPREEKYNIKFFHSGKEILNIVY